MKNRITSPAQAVSVLILLLSLVVPFGEDRSASGATDPVIGTVTRVSTHAMSMEVQSGQIAERYTSAVSVDGVTYTLASNTIFSDDLGNARQWDEFQREDFVIFHLKAGEIDALVMLLPR